MFQVNVRAYVADSVERVGFQDAVAKGASPDSANSGKDIVHGLWSQALFEKLRLE